MELAQRFAAYAGYTLEITPMSFDKLLPSVQAGNVDFTGELIIITEARKRPVDFSEPYYCGGTVLVVPSSLAEFTSAHIGALVGTVFADFIDPVISGVQHTYYPSQADMVAALSKGEVDAISLDMPVAKYVAAQNPSLTVFPEVLAADRYGFALVKGAPLADKVNEAIRKLRNNGAIAALEKVWFSADESVKKLPSLNYKKDFDGSAGTLRYGCENSTAPVSYINADGKPVGFDLAVVSYIAYELNMKVEFYPMGFNNVFTALASGEIDMAGGSMSMTEYRQQNYSCVGPYYDGGVVLVVKK